MSTPEFPERMKSVLDFLGLVADVQERSAEMCTQANLKLPPLSVHQDSELHPQLTGFIESTALLHMLDLLHVS